MTGREMKGDWTLLKQRIDRLVSDPAIKILAERMSSLQSVSIERQIAEIVSRCKADPAFYKELKAQLRELRGLPR